MDDYGDEWMLTTANPLYGYHTLVSLADEGSLVHEQFMDQCRCPNPNYEHYENVAPYFTCGDGADRGFKWSAMMAKSNAETDAQPAWQETLLAERLRNIWVENVASVSYEDEKLYIERSNAHDELAEKEWKLFYAKYPQLRSKYN